MVATEEEEDIAVAAQADDIAQKLTQYLIEGFKAKTGRDPDRDEIEQLFEELTPERMTELLGQETSLNSLDESSPEDEDDNEDGDGEDDDDNDEDEDEDGDDVKEEDDSKVDDIDEGKDSNGSLNHGSEILTGKVPVPRKVYPDLLTVDDTTVGAAGNENKRTLASSDASTSCTTDKTDKRVREN